jgi:hypothetical protein
MQEMVKLSGLEGNMSEEIQLSHGKIAIVDDNDFEWLSQWKWSYNGHGYAERVICRNGIQSHIIMHRLIINTPDNMDTDHINHNGLDNRRCNLRVCTPSQNQANQRMRSDNTSGRIGVSWKKQKGKYESYIRHNGKLLYLGSFDDINKASDVYQLKAKELFGEFAEINRIDTESGTNRIIDDEDGTELKV